MMMVKIQRAYCSACDREVRIALTALPVHAGQAPIPDELQLVCLDFGERCTGSMCPMFGVDNVIMGVRLARSGLDHEWRTIRAPCPACEQVSELEILNERHAFCPLCSSTVRYARYRTEDDDIIALAGV